MEVMLKTISIRHELETKCCLHLLLLKFVCRMSSCVKCGSNASHNYKGSMSASKVQYNLVSVKTNGGHIGAVLYRRCNSFVVYALWIRLWGYNFSAIIKVIQRLKLIIITPAGPSILLSLCRNVNFPNEWVSTYSNGRPISPNCSLTKFPPSFLVRPIKRIYCYGITL